MMPNRSHLEPLPTPAARCAPLVRCIYRSRHQFYEACMENANLSRESGAENSKRIVVVKTANGCSITSMGLTMG